MYLVLLYIAYHSFFVIRNRFGHAVRGFLRVHLSISFAYSYGVYLNLVLVNMVSRKPVA